MINYNIKQIDENELKNLNIKILIITANSIEKEELQRRMVPHKDEKFWCHTNGANFYFTGYFGRYVIAHVHCLAQGTIKPNNVVHTIQSARQLFNPELIIMIGIAYGSDSKKQNIGDVLLAKKIKSTGSIKRSKNGTIEDRNIGISPSESITTMLTNFQFQDIKFSIHKGTIISGEDLINDIDYKQQLLDLFEYTNGDNIIGGEMEGIGIASSLKSNESHNWIVIKGISDWADGNKDINKDEYQYIAAKNAVYVCWCFLLSSTIYSLKNISFEILKKQYLHARAYINGCNLFYFRQKMGIGKKSLDKKWNNNHITINKLEDVNFESSFHYHKSIGFVPSLKLQKILKCENNELINIDVDDRIMNLFNNKRGKNSFTPIHNFKIVVFDFDGTITLKNNYSTWEHIWLELGYTIDDCAALHRKYSNEDINHKEWCDLTAEKFRLKKLNKNMLDNIINKIELVKNVQAVFEILIEQNVKIYICSGSINYIIDNVLKKFNLKKYLTSVSSNLFTFDDDLFENINGTEYDFIGKSKFIEKIAGKNNVSTSEILFVGNSNNDQEVWRSGASTLVVNPKLIDPNDRKIWNYIIKEMKDFKQILRYVLPEDYN